MNLAILTASCKLSSQYLSAEKQINDAKLQQAQADLQSATTLAEKESAIQRIYDVTVANAKLEYQATIAAAEAELRKVKQHCVMQRFCNNKFKLKFSCKQQEDF